MLKFTERPKTPGITSKQTWLSLKGITCLQVIVMLIWMKQTLTWFNLQRDGIGNGLYNISDIFAESLQPQMSVLHQSMCTFNAGLSSSYDGWEKYKKKCLMCPIPIPNSCLHELKIYQLKWCRKTSQRWILYAVYVAT